ncbi:transposase [Streptomyces sp. NPDC056390]|uniref:IS110 family transposase n=1 Tax=Streptomyces sp. NPDC056390 TaxID=3345806 RepID=UPI0035D99C21
MQRQVEVVVMEATSDYWRGIYYLLQPHLNLMLVNPAHLKGIRGRKTDPNDAAFLARAGAAGMVMAFFVPPRGIRELRDLTRRRTELVRAAGWESQRLEKELEDTGMKLSAVLSDVTGVKRPGHPGTPHLRRTRSSPSRRSHPRTGPQQDPGARRGPRRRVHRPSRVHGPALSGRDRPLEERHRHLRRADCNPAGRPGARHGQPRHHSRNRTPRRGDHPR